MVSVRLSKPRPLLFWNTTNRYSFLLFLHNYQPFHFQLFQNHCHYFLHCFLKKVAFIHIISTNFFIRCDAKKSYQNFYRYFTDEKVLQFAYKFDFFDRVMNKDMPIFKAQLNNFLNRENSAPKMTLLKISRKKVPKFLEVCNFWDI